MTEKKFNLIEEPWILVIDQEENLQQVSMLELFENAHKYICLAGELPTQDIAILRVLLAVVYSVFTNFDKDGEEITLTTEEDALKQWGSLWSEGCFPSEQIKDYLEHNYEHFFLFHPETPFFQVAGLHTAKGEINAVTQIIADVPSRAERRFFTNRLGRSISSLSYSEAARWLIHLHAWDYAGKKASVVEGSPNGGGTGWLGKLGVISLEGNNLFETLMLNFVLIDEDGLLNIGDPVWHGPCTKPEKNEIIPESFVELLTLQSRRVLLFEENGSVVGVLSSYGDVFNKEGTFFEEMSGWRKSTQGKSSSDTFLPKLLSKERLLWRDLTSLLPYEKGSPNSSDHRRPGTLWWRGYLQENRLIERDSVRIAAIGIEYGAMMGVVNEVISDRLSFNADLLTSLGETWTLPIEKVLDATDKAVWCLGKLARDLELASGADEQSPNLKAIAGNTRSLAYATLDEPFRAWLASINPEGSDPDDRCIEWKKKAYMILKKLGEDMVSECNPKALSGIKGGKNAPSAYHSFKTSLYNELKFSETKGVENE